MTPSARVAAAIEILDSYLTGEPAEKALTNWARRSRFAGSKDRAAVRDLVFTALRQRRSLGGCQANASGRAWMIALHHKTGADLSQIFAGEGYGAAAIAEDETPYQPEDADYWDLPDWCICQLTQDHGDKAQALSTVLKARAPISLRCNLRQETRDNVQKALAKESVASVENPMAHTAITVTENPRRVQGSKPMQDGWLELQDAASQAVAALIPDAERILDYCAGGGGKSLAVADRATGQVFAHDAQTQRLKDLPDRAKRARVKIPVLATTELAANAPYGTVFCDVPCSGSGAWRRSPEGKWAITADKLVELQALQRQIVRQAQPLCGAGGTFAYITCSLFRAENQDQTAWIVQNFPGLTLTAEHQFLPDANGDGFYLALFVCA